MAHGKKTARFNFLGTGTSTGVPVAGCDCPVCRSTDPHDTRFRSSALVTHGKYNLVIDTGPDFRSQALRANIMHLNAVLLTHGHADHVFGFDDIRAYSLFKKKTLPVFSARDTLDSIRRRFDYIWNAVQIGGGLPDVALFPVDKPFVAGGMTITPIPILHGKLPILGYRIGDLAYMTDISSLPDSAVPLLENLGTMVISCVRRRIHRTHLTIRDAIRMHNRIAPRQTILTHLTHYLSHKEWIAACSDNMLPAYDGMTIEIAL